MSCELHIINNLNVKSIELSKDFTKKLSKVPQINVIAGSIITFELDSNYQNNSDILALNEKVAAHLNKVFLKDVYGESFKIEKTNNGQSRIEFVYSPKLIETYKEKSKQNSQYSMQSDDEVINSDPFKDYLSNISKIITHRIDHLKVQLERKDIKNRVAIREELDNHQKALDDVITPMSSIADNNLMTAKIIEKLAKDDIKYALNLISTGKLENVFAGEMILTFYNKLSNFTAKTFVENPTKETRDIFNEIVSQTSTELDTLSHTKKEIVKNIYSNLATVTNSEHREELISTLFSDYKDISGATSIFLSFTKDNNPLIQQLKHIFDGEDLKLQRGANQTKIRLDELKPLVDKKLIALGHKHTMFGFDKPDYSIFYSDETGNSTYTQKVTQKYTEDVQRSQSTFLDQVKAANSDPQNKHKLLSLAHKNKRAAFKEHSIVINFNKIPELFNHSKHFENFYTDAEKSAYKKELVSVLGDVSYKQLIIDSENLISTYEQDLKYYLSKNKSDYFVTNYSPFIVAEDFDKKLNEPKKSEYFNTDYLTYIPKSTRKFNDNITGEVLEESTNYYNKDFNEIENHEELLELHKILMKTSRNMSILTDNYIQEGDALHMEKSAFENLTDPYITKSAKLSKTFNKITKEFANFILESNHQITPNEFFKSLNLKYSTVSKKAEKTSSFRKEVKNEAKEILAELKKDLGIPLSSRIHAGYNLNGYDIRKNETVLNLFKYLHGITETDKTEIIKQLSTKMNSVNKANIFNEILKATALKRYDESKRDLFKVLKFHIYNAALTEARENALSQVTVIKDVIEKEYKNNFRSLKALENAYNKFFLNKNELNKKSEPNTNKKEYTKSKETRKKIEDKERLLSKLALDTTEEGSKLKESLENEIETLKYGKSVTGDFILKGLSKLIVFFNLAMSIPGAISNKIQGLKSNRTYFSQRGEAYEREYIYASTIARRVSYEAVSAGIYDFALKNINKEAYNDLLKFHNAMVEFNFIQDNTQIETKANRSKSYNVKKILNPFMLIQLVELGNQTPLLIAEMKVVKFKDGTSVWDALDENMNLLPKFKDFNEEYEDLRGLIKTRVDDANMSTHGDFMLGPTTSHRVMTMLFVHKRWLPEYLHNLYAPMRINSAKGVKEIGELRGSSTIASALLFTVPAYIFGLPILATIPIGVAVGALERWKNKTTTSLKDEGKVFTNILLNALPLKRTGIQSLLRKYGINNIGFNLNETHQKELDKMNREAKVNATRRISIHMAQVLNTMILTMALAGLYRWGQEDDEEELFSDLSFISKMQRMVHNLLSEPVNNVLKNILNRSLSESFIGVNLPINEPSEFASIVPITTAMQKIESIGKAYDKKSEGIIFNELGENRVNSAWKKALLPSIGKGDLGFKSQMKGVYGESNFSKNMSKEDPTAEEALQDRRDAVLNRARAYETVYMDTYYPNLKGEERDAIAEAFRKTYFPRKKKNETMEQVIYRDSINYVMLQNANMLLVE